MITYYDHVTMTHGTHSPQTDRPLPQPGDQPGDQLSGGRKVVHSSIDFRREVREILGGDTSGTIRVLIASVLIQVIYWFSVFKIVVGYNPYELRY
jgi:hypothetical protein